MRHFDSSTWVDFARGLLPEERTTEIREHLHRGCRVCDEEQRFWARLRAVARISAAMEPPPEAARRALAEFRSSFPPEVKSGIRLPLVFDSWSSPAYAGVRSPMAVSGRHLLFESQEVTVDVSLQKDEHDRQTRVLGQVIRKDDQDAPVARARVVLKAANGIAVQAQTDEQGEFSLPVESLHDVTLTVELQDGRRILLILPEKGMQSGGREA
jgi:hypothetical protein